MFRSIEEDKEFLSQIFVFQSRNWLDDIFRLNTFSIDMFCFIFNRVHFRVPGNQYYIRATPSYHDNDLGALVPYSIELAFWSDQRGSPVNNVWVRDGLLSWHRNRDRDRALIGVPMIQEFIGSLYGNN